MDLSCLASCVRYFTHIFVFLRLYIHSIIFLACLIEKDFSLNFLVTFLNLCNGMGGAGASRTFAMPSCLPVKGIIAGKDFQ